MQASPRLQEKREATRSQVGVVTVGVANVWVWLVCGCAIPDCNDLQFPRGLGWGMPANKKVRGQPDEDEDEMAELEEKLKAAELPSHALKVAQKELKVCAPTVEFLELHLKLDMTPWNTAHPHTGILYWKDLSRPCRSRSWQCIASYQATGIHQCGSVAWSP